jgi:TonB family protein
MRSKSILVAITLAPLLIGASKPIRLQPSSPWDVDYAENSCRLIRVFGDSDSSKTVLILESGAPDQMDMLVVGKSMTTYADKVAATFLPMGSKSIEGDVIEDVRTHTPAVLWPQVPMLPDDVLGKLQREREQRRARPGVRPPALDLDEEAGYRQKRQEFATQATELEIGTRHSQPVILETGSLGEPMRSFNKCSRDSLKDWGVNPEMEDKIVRPVWPSKSDLWFSSSDYPADMAARGEESQVEIRLLVDATGKVTKCTSLSHFKEQEFNKITCAAVMKRARFEPAELADGTKVPSYYIRRVIFRMGR